MGEAKISKSSLQKRQARRKVADNANILQEMLLEIMNERNLQIADIHRGTGIPYATLQDWIQKKSNAQRLDSNILALSRFLNCSISYLAFGVGESEPIYNNERAGVNE